MADKNMEAQISVEFEEATSRQSLNSGETINTLWGKVKRWLSDLKTVCFSGSYNDLSDRPTTATTDTDGLMSAEDKGKLDSADDTYALKSKYGDTTIDVGRKSGTTVGIRSTAEGNNTTASGNSSHAEGAGTTASDSCSHAEGYLCTASSDNSHAEGNNTTASGAHSHAEGSTTTASGVGSHSGGTSSTASGDYSFAHGMYVESNNSCEVSLGKFNKSSSDTRFSIGDGTSDTARHNAFEITKTGGKLHDKDIATTDLIPTSLPANGGNADTVDGLHASDFMPINGEVRKYGTIRMNGADGIRVRHIDGNDTEADGALYLNYNSPNATIYMNGTNTAIHSGNIGSQSVANAVTAHQIISPSSKVRLWEDNEGGNLELVAPDGVHSMQMDLYNNEGFRMYFYDGEKLSFPLSFDFSSQKLNINGNADTVNGLHAYNMATLNAGGGSHGTNFPMYCKHNVLGDNRFYIGVSGGYERSVAVGFAESAGYVNPNVVVKSLTFPNVPLNESGWGSLGINTSDYNIIGCTCTTNDRHARVYRGNNATGWFVYVTQQYPTPGVTAANEVVNVVVFYI